MDAWYLGVYIDDIEWVEMPNTRGMSLFADNGLIATKPYCAGGNYINKMSDHCKHCHYKVKQKTEATACPFNSLYWDFMIRHRERLVPAEPGQVIAIAQFKKTVKPESGLTPHNWYE